MICLNYVNAPHRAAIFGAASETDMTPAMLPPVIRHTVAFDFVGLVLQVAISSVSTLLVSTGSRY